MLSITVAAQDTAIDIVQKQDSAFCKSTQKIRLPQTKKYNYETGPQISTTFCMDAAGILLLFCAKCGGVWAKGFWVMIF